MPIKTKGRREDRGNPNPWDELADAFDTQMDAGEIDPGAADNVLIAWPAILSAIDRHGAPFSRTRRALDYGCGTGGFARRLATMGFDVIGADTSRKMIEKARQQSPDSIKYHCIDAEGLHQLETSTFDVITSIMVLQFIKDLEASALDIASLVEDGGIIVLAVFNPDFITSNLGEGRLFQASSNQGQVLLVPTSELAIDVFMRSPLDYERAFAAAGCQCLARRRPKFTKKYVEKYSPPFDVRVPEFLVLTFRKVERAE